jgi:hypothetical protein
MLASYQDDPNRNRDPQTPTDGRDDFTSDGRPVQPADIARLSTREMIAPIVAASPELLAHGDKPLH